MICVPLKFRAAGCACIVTTLPPAVRPPDLVKLG
jgi:hypothetical protein